MEDHDRILEQAAPCLICSQPNMERPPRCGKRIVQRFAEPTALPGERVHISVIATRGDAARIISLRKANENVRDGMKDRENDPASRPHEDNPELTRTDIKKAGPALEMVGEILGGPGA